ncbi:MAG: polysaccharide biosynthesis tyrosine autokinase, partial [Deltaproteobacteria bacterium]|nr:polysaccharide biosynthesis tyrosine autokinase [Deltaproteobacteria bacterium]
QINLLGKSLPAVSIGKGKPGSPIYRESAQSLEIELARKRERLAELSEKYTDKVPEVASAKADVEQLELLVEQARRAASRQVAGDMTVASVAIAAPPAAIEEIRQMKARQKAGGVELESLKKEAGEIRKAIAAVERKIEQSPRREQEMISMVRDYENQKQSYDDLLKKKLEADVSQNLEKRQKGTQFLVIDPANLPEEPFRPDRKKVMGGSLLLALALGFGAVIGLEAMDQRLRDVSDFRHLYKVPILGSIPALKASPASARPAASGEAPGMVSRLGAVFGNGQAKSPDRHSLFRSTDHIFGEQQKNFCSRVEYAIDSKELKVVAVTSSIAGEGKTVSTVNLANNLAGAGRKKVVLVDLDLRKSDLAKGLRFPSTPGVVERLNGSAKLEEVLRYVSSQGLSVIPSGKRIDDPWELLKGERFRAFLNELKDRFDVVLLDTPPMVPVSDTITLREHVDGFVLVFRLGYTPHVLFRQALEGIGEKKLLGVLLNGAQAKSEKYYQRYYGKYY